MQCTIAVKTDSERFSTTETRKYLSESFSAKFEVQQPQIPEAGERSWSWGQPGAQPLQPEQLPGQETQRQSQQKPSSPHRPTQISASQCRFGAV